MIPLLDWHWLGHHFGIGISLDWWNWWIHPLVYGLTVPVVAVLVVWVRLSRLNWKLLKTFFVGQLDVGLIASMTAALYLEILQTWQYNWNCGWGDPLDLLLSWLAAYGVYRMLRRP